MSNIHEDFYYCNIEPQESITELKPEFKKKLTTLAQTEKLLASKPIEEKMDIFLKYTSQSSEFLCVSNAYSFIAGFRLGIKFTYNTFVAD